MNVVPTHILLLANHTHVQGYNNAFNAYGTILHICSELANLAETPPLPLNGLVFDGPTFDKLPARHRMIFTNHAYRFPLVRSEYDNNKGILVKASHNAPQNIDIREFLDVCAMTSPRRIRRAARSEQFVSAIIRNTDTLTATTNLSLMGCFLLTTEQYQIGSRLQISLTTQTTETIESVVQRHVPWGHPFQPAGIGVEFVSLSPYQKNFINRLIEEENPF